MSVDGARPEPIKRLVQENFQGPGGPWGLTEQVICQRRVGWKEGRRARVDGQDPVHPKPSPLSPTDDEDANSYENVLICKQKQPESGEVVNLELGRG